MYDVWTYSMCQYDFYAKFCYFQEIVPYVAEVFYSYMKPETDNEEFASGRWKSLHQMHEVFKNKSSVE